MRALVDLGGALVETGQKEEGCLVVFPSYLWHRILPFENRGERISYAFDVVTVD